MKILILGGTAFLSETTARQALERGHQVTCLARGSQRNPPAGADWIRADRDAGPEAYAEVGRSEWDAVIDVARQPIQVRQALDALADRSRHWTFVSTCSVYADDTTPGQDESAALLPAFIGDSVTDLADYGAGKVTCEQSCLEVVGDRLHLSRPGLISGPGDDSDRFGWWPARFARQRDDDVLVPDARSFGMQVIDVDDLARWLLVAVEQSITGIFNAVGESATFGDFVDVAQQVARHQGQQVVVDQDFLVDHGVGYWAGPDSLGLWLPPDHTGMGSRSNAAAISAGMRLRSIQESTERALTYERELGLDRDRQTGLTPAREAELLALWSVR